MGDEHEGRSDEREGMSEGPGEVEGHGMTDGPTADGPTADATDEGDDVEAHGMTDGPTADGPTADALGDRPSSDGPTAD